METGSSRPRVIVVGGSLAGLNASLWLREAGCDVEVFERTSVPLEGRGTGIVMHPATIRYMVEHNGLDLDRISVAARWIRYVGPDGRILNEDACRYRFTAYNEIYAGMMEHVDERRYHLGEECAGFDLDSDSVTVRFASGRTEQCDLVVFADGINSVGRRTLLPEIEPTYSGYIAWRGTIGEDELTPETFSVLREAITYAPMPDSHILSYPIPQHDVSGSDTTARLTNWLWYRNVAPDDLEELLTGKSGERFSTSVPPGFAQERHLQRLRDDALTLPPPMTELVHNTREPFIQVIIDIEVPRMAFGRACIIGDAAFTARPHAAAGTAKAAEDAWTLARALESNRGDIPTALAEWEPGQLTLGRRLVARGHDAGNRLQSGAWEVTEPLPFGLYEVGDNAID